MTEPIWIEKSEALILHERLLVLHGGAPGIRDKALLNSALARPRQHAAYADQVDFIFLAALYTAAIVRNHPFVDGNKRTGFVLGVLFLELNGYRFTADQAEAAQAVIALAAGNLDEHQFAAFLRENAAP